MGCGQLKPPEIPELDTSKIPQGLNLPKGMSVNDLKSKVENPGIGDALNNAGDMIKKNIQGTLDDLNPVNIVSKVGDAIGDVVGGIVDTVGDVVNGVTSLLDRLPNKDDIAKKIPDSPESVFDKVQSEAGKALDTLTLGAFTKRKKCDEEYIKEAGQVNTDIKQRAEAAAGDITNKERLELKKDPAKMEQKKQQIQTQVTEQTKSQTAAAATKQNKEAKTVQQEVQKETLDVVVKNKTGNCDDLVMLTGMLRYMIYLQLKMYNGLRAINDQLTRAQTLLANPERFAPKDSGEPHLLYEIITNSIAIKARSRVAKWMMQRWRDICDDESIYPRADNMIGDIDYKSKLYQLSSVYAPGNVIPTGGPRYHYGHVNWTSEKLVDEYFQLWNDEHWLYDELLNANGVTVDLIDAGLTGGAGDWPGYLSVSDAYADQPWLTRVRNLYAGNLSGRSDVLERSLDFIYGDTVTQTSKLPRGSLSIITEYRPELMSDYDSTKNDWVWCQVSNSPYPLSDYNGAPKSGAYYILTNVDWKNLEISNDMKYIPSDQHLGQRNAREIQQQLKEAIEG